MSPWSFEVLNWVSVNIKDPIVHRFFWSHQHFNLDHLSPTTDNVVNHKEAYVSIISSLYDFWFSH